MQKHNKNGGIRQHPTPMRGAGPHSHQVGNFIKDVIGDLVVQELVLS